MKYFIISLLVFVSIKCFKEPNRVKAFNFSNDSIGVDLKLNLPEDWVTYKAPEFLDGDLVYNQTLGTVDSSSCINVKIYINDDFLSGDLNSLLNWQGGLELSGSESIKLEKRIESIHDGKNSIGLLRLIYPGVGETWYARKIIIKEGPKVTVLHITDRMDEERLERISQNIISDLNGR